MLPRVDLIRTKEVNYLLMNSPDHISDFIRKNGSWGQTEATICKAFISLFEKNIVIDAGANLGGFTVPIAKALKSSGKVFSFEPQRIVFQQLCSNIFINELDNVFTHNVALGNEISTIEIPEIDFHGSANVGGFSISKEIRGEIENDAKLGRAYSNKYIENEKFIVPLTSLDSYKIFSDVTFIKADVEGFELEFFQGARDTIINNNYPPIVFELWENKDWYLEKGKKTTAYLAELGYYFEKFGREILAQHPSFSKKINVKRKDSAIELQAARAD